MTRKALQEIKGLQADHDYMKNALKRIFQLLWERNWKKGLKKDSGK